MAGRNNQQEPGDRASAMTPKRRRMALRQQERRERAMRRALAGRLSEGVAVALAGIALADIRAPNRCRRPVAEARQIGMYLLHQVFEEPLSRAARAFGRDRTTAHHAVAAIRKASADQEHHALRIAAAPVEPALAAWADRFSALIADAEREA